MKLMPRFRFQFTLATLLLLMLAACAVAGAYGAMQRAVAAQERAFERIAAKGGVVLVWENGTTIQFQPPGPCCATGLERMVGDFAPSPTFNDADLKQLDQVIQLLRVDFSGSRVSPAAVAAFRTAHTNCKVRL